MALYLRYLSTDELPLSFPLLGEALGNLEPSFSIVEARGRHWVMRGTGCFGEIALTSPGETLFDEEMDDLKSALAHLDELATRPIRQCFQQTRSMVVVRVVWERRDNEETLAGLKPLWQWLLSNCNGLLQVDEEGYYNAQGLVLAVPL